MNARAVLLVILLVAASADAQYLRPGDVARLPARPADLRAAYGSDPRQFGELRLPQGAGPHPVAIVVHGGCYLSRFADLKIMDSFSDALARAGIASWNVEYRLVDQPGGGWPGTFLDIAWAADHLRVLGREHPLDLGRVIAIGHSAGGHLALWLGARHRLTASSPLYVSDPLRVRGVLCLGGLADLESFGGERARRVCGDDVIAKLVGGSPAEVPDRYRQVSPRELLPLAVRQVLITGAADGAVPPDHGRKYAADARAAGDAAEFIEIEKAGHFEVIAPATPAWAVVEKSARSLVEARAQR